jgi:hypothetical protein
MFNPFPHKEQCGCEVRHTGDFEILTMHYQRYSWWGKKLGEPVIQKYYNCFGAMSDWRKRDGSSVSGGMDDSLSRAYWKLKRREHDGELKETFQKIDPE